MAQAGETRSTSISAAIGAVNSLLTASADAPALCFPPEDGGHSLADFARRDLDATLQLLAQRAQYITDASGAAIALRRDHSADMLCCASIGSNAPELGALLSTETGISGESVRTRLALRCDDAARDSRVNREGCRLLGICSVAVMPIISDEQVIGVFELFSGKVNAFSERDLYALERLGQMVETAIKLVHAAQAQIAITPEYATASDAVHAHQADLIRGELNAPHSMPIEVEPEAPNASADLLQPQMEQESRLEASRPSARGAARIDQMHGILASDAAAPPASSPEAAGSGAASKESVPKKTLLWSAAQELSGPILSAPDPQNLPAALRNLRKCQACGFPVSDGRNLCVECEEKKWKGRLQAPRATALAAGAAAAPGGAAVPTHDMKPDPPAAAVVALPASAALAQAATSGRPSTWPGVDASTPKARADSPEDAIEPQSSILSPGEPSSTMFTASLSPQPSWFASFKYILGALLIVGGIVAVILLR